MAPNPDGSEIWLNLLVDKNNNKVIFAETGKDFVDFLFGLLQLPLGSILRLLPNYGYEVGSGSLTKVYDSIEDLDPSHLLQQELTKDSLLNPKLEFESSSVIPPLLLNFVGLVPRVGVSQKGEGYVKGVVTYMVMDDLTVKPMSNISSISLLNSLKIKDLSSLQEKEVEFDFEKGLELVQASLNSTTVLTDIFLGQK